MEKVYFISDVHIKSPDDSMGVQFLKFIKSLSKSNATHLFLLGDIFDLWIADHKYFKSKFKTIIDELIRIKNEGIEIHYFEGNHDLHLTQYFQNQLHFNVHSGPEYFYLAGKNIRVEHGDQMDPEDRGYIFLRWFLRTKPIQFLLENLPGEFVAMMGEKASLGSRKYTSQVKTISSEKVLEKIHKHAELVYKLKPFDLIITGHVHAQDDYQTPNYRSINLGWWMDGAKCLYLTPQECAFQKI